MKNYPLYKLQTKNGIHILAPGFDVITFNKEMLTYQNVTITVFKDADTLLFV